MYCTGGALFLFESPSHNPSWPLVGNKATTLLFLLTPNRCQKAATAFYLLFQYWWWMHVHDTLTQTLPNVISVKKCTFVVMFIHAHVVLSSFKVFSENKLRLENPKGQLLCSLLCQCTARRCLSLHWNRFCFMYYLHGSSWWALQPKKPKVPPYLIVI